MSQHQSPPIAYHKHDSMHTLLTKSSLSSSTIPRKWGFLEGAEHLSMHHSLQLPPLEDSLLSSWQDNSQATSAYITLQMLCDLTRHTFPVAWSLSRLPDL